jgi:RNA polymerase sigma-70 factor (ECF subfamily)
MLTAARNIALNHIARADALDHVEAAPPEFAEPLTGMDSEVDGVDSRGSTVDSAEQMAQAEEEFLTFCRAVRELPIQCRRAFILKKVYGFSQREIARELGLTESTVEKHIAKGIAACSAYMFERGYARGESNLASDGASTKRGSE